jgi:hypothetical protein
MMCSIMAAHYIPGIDRAVMKAMMLLEDTIMARGFSQKTARFIMAAICITGTGKPTFEQKAHPDPDRCQKVNPAGH